MRVRLSSRVLGWVLGVSMCTALGSAAHAKILHSKEGALRLAFPNGEAVKPLHLFLDELQVAAIERQSGARVKSRVVTLYVGDKGGQPTGFALIDSHVVRTLPETFMVVFDADGRVRAVHILAFHEPLEYLPGRSWLRQFAGRTLSTGLRMRGDIAGIAGATMSAQAITKGVRKALATFQVALRGAGPQS